MKKNTIERRRFIQMGVLGTCSILLMPRCLSITNESSWRFFTKKEAVLVDAIVEQIIPTDRWPGAKEAGVTNFIDKQLVGPYQRYQENYRRALAVMDLACTELHGKFFEELTWDEQTKFLELIELGELQLPNENGKTRKSEKIIWDKGEDKLFFLLIRDHTMQGYYGSPRHGGNKNFVSYKMMRLDYPYIIGQNRYSSKS